ncbi:MAG: hypothetical protein MZW92_43245 [Comamonadaceae bacterium]|nr:hypothetical protein [Comamonadaceae bacterium]
MTLRLCLQPTAHAAGPARRAGMRCSAARCWAILRRRPRPPTGPRRRSHAPLLGGGAGWLCEVWRGAGAL